MNRSAVCSADWLPVSAGRRIRLQAKGARHASPGRKRIAGLEGNPARLHARVLGLGFVKEGPGQLACVVSSTLEGWLSCLAGDTSVLPGRGEEPSHRGRHITSPLVACAAVGVGDALDAFHLHQTSRPRNQQQGEHILLVRFFFFSCRRTSASAGSGAAILRLSDS